MIASLAKKVRKSSLVLPFRVAVIVAAAGCAGEPVDARPERVVEEFVARAQRVHGDPKSAREAYEILWSDARRNLAERAKRASAVAGHKIAPEEMIAPSRFSLQFKPKRFSARVEGDWAIVTVTSDAPEAQPHEVKCVREDGLWRVVLELPPLPPIQKRPDEDHPS